MKFKIVKTKSDKKWKQLTPSSIWEMLKSGIDAAAATTGATDADKEEVLSALKEVYALQLTDDKDLKKLAQDNFWGVHHEVLEDGTIMVNVEGVTEAANLLLKDKELSDAQKKSAAKHLLAHYKETGTETEAPAELAGLAGEMDPGADNLHVLLTANVFGISGEMRIDDIPLAPGVDVASLKVGDSDPFEVVVEVPVGTSTRKWKYTPKALQSIVNTVMTKTLNGFLGHQKPSEVSTEFPDIATHWVGAKFDAERPVMNEAGQIIGKGVAYFRGVVDKEVPKLKRWIRTQRVKQVSIFGYPKLVTNANGETEVVDYDALSIDWTPLDRSGMPTKIVAVGEMDQIIGGSEKAPKKYQGGNNMTLAELLAALKKYKADGTLNPRLMAGEMGWNTQDMVQAVGEMDPILGGKIAKIDTLETIPTLQGEIATLKTDKETLTGEMSGLKTFVGEIKTSLGNEKMTDDEAKTAISAATKVAGELALAKHTELVNTVLTEKVKHDKVRILVGEMLTVAAGTEKAEIEKAVGEIMDRQVVKDYVDAILTNPKHRHMKDNRGSGGTERKATRTKSVSI